MLKLVFRIAFVLLLFSNCCPAAVSAQTPAGSDARLDVYARTLPEREAGSVAQLAAALGRAARTDRDKARLIFAWLTTHVQYDTDYLRGSRARSYTPAEVLRHRRSICQGYADLFTALAKAMKLPAHTVTGFARNGPDQRPSGPTDTNHAWSTYQADGRWHVADATWGAGGVDDALLFHANFKPWYFDPVPAAFLFSHWPQEARWQLLPTPLAQADFAAWPYVDPLLFERGVSGAALQRALARRRTPGPLVLPTMYACELAAQLEQLPLAAELEPGRPVLFRLEVPTDVVVGIENGGRTQVLPAAGAFREGILKPRPGALRVLLWTSNGYLRHTLLEYRVPPVPTLRERRQRWPDTANVAYLLRYRAQWTGALSSSP